MAEDYGTPSEKILEALTVIAHGLAHQFGKNCEVIVHDLSSKDPEKTILYIANGEVSGRKAGDGPSKVVLKTIRALKNGEPVSDHLCYLTRTKDGRILKSSTMFLKDIEGNYRYLFGINYDITNLVSIDDGLRSLIEVEEKSEKPSDSIPSTVNELLDSLIEQSVAMIGRQPALMTKDEKVRAIRFLNDAGAFLITKSGDKVSSYFGISKFTLYSYIDVNKNGRNQS